MLYYFYEIGHYIRNSRMIQILVVIYIHPRRTLYYVESLPLETRYLKQNKKKYNKDIKLTIFHGEDYICRD